MSLRMTVIEGAVRERPLDRPLRQVREVESTASDLSRQGANW